MRKINVLSVNVSEQKGTPKHPVRSVILTEKGVEGDAHNGPWNRQVSLLGIESIRKFEKETGRKIGYGEFAENITTEGMELWRCQPLDRFAGDGFDLEVTQIGKECHGNTCSIFNEVGTCVMPKEGIFARVVGSGQCAVGSGQMDGYRIPDTGYLEPETWNLKPETTLLYQPKVYSAHIITLSDRAFQGEYTDKSGPRIQELLENFFRSYEMPAMNPEADTMSLEQKDLPEPSPSSLASPRSSFIPRLSSSVTLIPDDQELLRRRLEEAIQSGTDFIFTTGGTGIGPRDITVDVVRSVLDREIPGIMEMIRVRYGREKPQALLSLSICGVTGRTLVFTLPGSVRAVNEYMEEILKSLMHMEYMLHGLDTH